MLRWVDTGVMVSYVGCDAQLPTSTWKLRLTRQALQPSWRHMIRWSSMLDSHHRMSSSRLRWSPTAQSTGMLFSFWASWSGNWRRLQNVQAPSLLFQYISFVAQRFNSVLLHDSFIDDDWPE